MKFIFLFILLFQLDVSLAQVSEIKSKSSQNASGGGSGGERRSSGSNAFQSYILIDFLLNGMAEWQQYKLQKRQSNPYLVSIDILGQVAVQPSRYYLANPRIRGNWGLLSTDFRVNYLVQEGINGLEDLATFDWQVLQLNVVTTRNVIGRVGGGFMSENFGGKGSFFESTYGLFIQSNNKKSGGTIEYRIARDFSTGAIPRSEVSVNVEKQLFTRGTWHAYATVGGVYQRYYESISVWGIQAGLAFRVFSEPLHGQQ